MKAQKQTKIKYFFVYGTLKIGGRFAKGFDELRKSSTAATVSGFDLHNLGAFPGVVHGTGQLHGEVHEYSEHEKVLASMDRIEGYDGTLNSLFVREVIDVVVDDKTVQAYIYVFNSSHRLPKSTLVETGRWNIGGNN